MMNLCWSTTVALAASSVCEENQYHLGIKFELRTELIGIWSILKDTKEEAFLEKILSKKKLVFVLLPRHNY